MRRFWIAIGLLAAILLGSSLNSRQLEAELGQLSARLEESAQLAQAQDWDGALRLTREAKQDWDSLHDRLHILLNHSGIREVQRGFERTLQFLRAESREESGAAIAELRYLLCSLWQSERLNPLNVL